MSRTSDYKAFCAEVRIERGERCQGCGRTAAECGQKALHVHHLWPIAKSGMTDGLVTAKCNVLLVCDWCHKLQHPARRSYPWDAAGRARGRSLRA
jgi:predicted HNH restriction endonuclease